MKNTNKKKPAGYTIATIRKVVTLINACIAKYENVAVENIKMCISKGNVKIGRVMNVSLPPIISCGNCKECRHFCYDIKACLLYANTVIDARVRNYTILKKDIDEYFRRIDAAMTRRRTNKYFRWHVSGDIISLDYFSRMVENARRHPEFVMIWTYTKMYSIVNEYIKNNGGSIAAALPNNFHVMFSEWDGMPVDNPYGFPVFSVKMTDGNINHAPEYFDNLYQCPGNCDICKELFRGCIAGESTYCNQH